MVKRLLRRSIARMEAFFDYVRNMGFFPEFTLEPFTELTLEQVKGSRAGSVKGSE
jgi:hypothetical protein